MTEMKTRIRDWRAPYVAPPRPETVEQRAKRLAYDDPGASPAWHEHDQ